MPPRAVWERAFTVACAMPPPSRAGTCLATTAPMTPPPRLALRGDLPDSTGAPEWGATDSPVVRFRPDHWLLVEDGRITGVQAEAPDATWTRHDHRGRLVLPGFIDTHVH